MLRLLTAAGAAAGAAAHFGGGESAPFHAPAGAGGGAHDRTPFGGRLANDLAKLGLELAPGAPDSRRGPTGEAGAGVTAVLDDNGQILVTCTRSGAPPSAEDRVIAEFWHAPGAAPLVARCADDEAYLRTGHGSVRLALPAAAAAGGSAAAAGSAEEPAAAEQLRGPVGVMLLVPEALPQLEAQQAPAQANIHVQQAAQLAVPRVQIAAVARLCVACEEGAHHGGWHHGRQHDEEGQAAAGEGAPPAAEGEEGAWRWRGGHTRRHHGFPGSRGEEGAAAAGFGIGEGRPVPVPMPAPMPLELELELPAAGEAPALSMPGGAPGLGQLLQKLLGSLGLGGSAGQGDAASSSSSSASDVAVGAAEAAEGQGEDGEEEQQQQQQQQEARGPAHRKGKHGWGGRLKRGGAVRRLGGDAPATGADAGASPSPNPEANSHTAADAKDAKIGSSLAQIAVFVGCAFLVREANKYARGAAAR